MPLICASRRMGCLQPIEGHAQILPGHMVSKNLSLKSAVLAVGLQVHRETKSQETQVRKQCDFRQPANVWCCKELSGRMVQLQDRISSYTLRTGKQVPNKTPVGHGGYCGSSGSSWTPFRRLCLVDVLSLKIPFKLPLYVGDISHFLALLKGISPATMITTQTTVASS